MYAPLGFQVSRTFVSHEKYILFALEGIHRMTDAVVSRQGDTNVLNRVAILISDHLLVITFVVLEVLTFGSGLVLDQMGRPVLAGIAGAAGFLVPITFLSVYGFLYLLRLIAPYLKTAG